MARLGRDNHLDNLLSRLPLLTTIYGIQCIMVANLAKNIDIGSFALYMGLSLICFITALYIHDKHHHVLLFSDHILIYFEPLKMSKKIMYDDIDDVLVPEDEVPFSSIIIKLKNDEHISLHFVDYPVQVKKVIYDIKHGNFEKPELKEAA